MRLNEAERYSKLLRKAGFYATPMWHWGNSNYAVVVANKLVVISTASEMLRWMQAHRVEKLINEREQAEQARSDITVGSRQTSSRDDS